jgi:DNA-binding transcriptional ArsR family regulator
MLRRLAEGPAKVTEIAEPFQMSLPSASKNLRVLENAGLIERRIVGRVHHCRLAPGALRDAGEWLAYYQNFWTGTLDAIARYVESEDEDRPGATKS